MAEPVLADAPLVALRQAIARIENATAGRAAPALSRARGWQAPAGMPAGAGAGSMAGSLEGTDADAAARPQDGPQDGPHARGPAGVLPGRLSIDGGMLDAALDGGLPLSGLSEVRSSAMRDHGAASGFTLALGRLVADRMARRVAIRPRILFIADPFCQREAGRLDAVGLAALGLDPDSIVHAAPRKLDEALMLAEAGLKVACFAAIILEIDGNPKRFGLTESRRLHLRARAQERPLLLLRARGEEEASSARLRLGLAPAPSGPVRLPGGRIMAAAIGAPRFTLSVEKSLTPQSARFILEWNPHDHVFSAALHPDTGSAGNQPRLGSGADERAHVEVVRGPAHPLGAVSAAGDRPDRADAMGRVLAFARSP